MDKIDNKNEIINKSLEKWIESKEPIRKVLLRADTCYICHQKKPNICEIATDDYNGYFNHYGWIYCKECEIIVDVSSKKYYDSLNYLGYSKCYNIINKNINFWRISSNYKIKQYLQKNAQIKKNLGNSLVCNKKRFFLPVQWSKDNYNVLYKQITLANAIFFNQNIFGNSITEHPFIDINNKWYNKIKKEYDIFQEIYLLQKILLRKKICKNIFLYILSFWNGFTELY